MKTLRLILCAFLLLSVCLAHDGEHGTTVLDNLGSDVIEKSAMGVHFSARLVYNPFEETRRGELVLAIYDSKGRPHRVAQVRGHIFPASDPATTTTLFFEREKEIPQAHVTRPLLVGGIPHTIEVQVSDHFNVEWLTFRGIEAKKAAAAATPPPPDEEKRGSRVALIPVGLLLAVFGGVAFVYWKRR